MLSSPDGNSVYGTNFMSGNLCFNNSRISGNILSDSHNRFEISPMVLPFKSAKRWSIRIFIGVKARATGIEHFEFHLFLQKKNNTLMRSPGFIILDCFGYCLCGTFHAWKRGYSRLRAGLSHPIGQLHGLPIFTSVKNDCERLR